MSKERALEKKVGAAPLRLRPEDLGIGVLFHVLPDAIMVVDTATARVGLFNPAAERLFGIEATEAIGQPLGHFLPEPCLSSLSSDGRAVEGVAKRPDGATLDVEISLTPLVQEQGYQVLVLRDIRDRKALEAESRLREAQLAEAEHIAQIGSWSWDLPTNRVRWSDELFRIAGQSPETFVPTYEDYLQAVHEADRTHVDAVVRRGLEDGAPFAYYARLVRPGCGVRTIHCRGSLVRDAAGQPTRMIGTVRDVTDSLRLEAALRESETKLRAIIDQAPDGIWLKDLEGRYVLINPAGAAIPGRTVEQVVGCKDGDLYDPDTARRITEIDERILASGKGETYEITVRAPGCGERTFFSIKYPYVREDGLIRGLVVITRDITERKRLEETLRAQYEQLKELDRLKNDFVNAVSHELRTPLTSIRGYLEFMEDGIGGTLNDQHAEFVQEIDRSAGRLTRLVDDLLDFARIQAGTFQLRFEPFDLADKIRELATSLVPQAEKGRVDLDVDADSPLVLRGDPQRIGQVLLNLANNAIKFTPEGGRVEVRACRMGDRLRCEVRDTGPGIAPADMSRLFQKFTQLSDGRNKGGSGLGLSISKAIVEAHGGTIGVESNPGEGSVFWFTLPVPADA